MFYLEMKGMVMGLACTIVQRRGKTDRACRHWSAEPRHLTGGQERPVNTDDAAQRDGHYWNAETLTYDVRHQNFMR